MTDGSPSRRAADARATVDEHAPVVGASEIVISADPETVWDVLASIEGWPAWNPDVKWVSIEGDVVEGTEFRWKSGPGAVTSTLRRVERPRLLAWTGRTFGIDAVHVWRFEPHDGATFVRTEESFDGLVARIFRRPLRRTLARDTTVEVASNVAPSSVAVRLHFDAAGDMVGAAADARPRMVGKTSVATPFRGRYGVYQVVGGMRVPTTAEVAWELEDGPFTYFRERLPDLELD